MLKIKDEIDLKKLEKFGFEFDIFYQEYKKRISNTGLNDYCYIENRTKEIKLFDGIEYCNVNEWNELLFELIKADMVEKVEE